MPSVPKGPGGTLDTSLTPDGCLSPQQPGASPLPWLWASAAPGPRWLSRSPQGRAPRGPSSPEAAGGADGRGATTPSMALGGQRRSGKGGHCSWPPGS